MQERNEGGNLPIIVDDFKLVGKGQIDQFWNSDQDEGNARDSVHDENNYDDDDYNDDDTKPLLGGLIATNSAYSTRRRSDDGHEKSLSITSFYESFVGAGQIIILGLSLCCILASFWLLDSLKDAVFDSLVGMEYQPTAKLCSVISTLLLVLFMEYGGNVTKNAKIFYVVGVPYFVTFLVIGNCLKQYEELVKKNEGEVMEKETWKLMGYFAYMAIESYGSLMVATFWAFTNKTLDLERAKKSYGIIVAIAQVGAIIGSTIAASANSLGLPMLFNIGSFGVLLAVLMITVYSVMYPIPRRKEVLNSFSYSADKLGGEIPSENEVSSASTSNNVSGIHLILKYNYLLLILGLSCLYEVVLTVIDYEMKLIGLAFIESGEDNESHGEKFAGVMGSFGIATNCLSLAISFFGFTYLMQTFGLKYTLRLYPSLLVVGVFMSFLIPNFWVLFVTMAVMKASTYSIFDPCKEILYVPTSHGAHYNL